MTSVITDALKIKNVKNFIHRVSEGGLFFFMGRPQPWSNDTLPPTPSGSITEQASISKSIISYKPVLQNNLYPITARINWQSGTVYEMYSDTITAGQEDVPAGTFPFYVMTDTFDVYVCVYNGATVDTPNGVPSIDRPTGRNPEPFVGPTDNYIWKYIYTLSSEAILNHLTNEYLPVESSPITPVSGEILSIVALTKGSGMVSNTELVPNYYCNIVGDGDGSVISFSVVNGQLNDVRVVRYGNSYTFASVDIVDGRIYGSLADLDNKVNPLSISGFKPTFKLTLPPPNGFTYDPINTLYANYLSINVKTNYGYQISGGDAAFFTDIDFRQYGLIDSPLLSNNDNPVNLNYTGCSSVKLSTGTGNYQYGETITQSVNGNTVSGFVVHWDSTNKILFYIQTNELNSVNGQLIKFSGSGVITGTTSLASYTPDFMFDGLNPSVGISYVDGYSNPQIKQNSGTLIYIKNIQPVSRTSTQVENFKFILKF